MEEILFSLGDSLLRFASACFDIFKFLVPFILTLFLYFSIKLSYRYYKYGYKDFSFLKKRDKVDSKQEMIFFMLDKIDGYRKIFVLKNLKSQLVIIDATGIYLLYIFNHEGIVDGKYKDAYLTNRSPNRKLVKIDNPYTLIEEDEAILENKLGSTIFYRCIVVNNTCLLTTEYDGPTQKIYYKDFFYKMETNFKKNSKVFSKADIDKYYRLLNNGVK